MATVCETFQQLFRATGGSTSTKTTSPATTSCWTAFQQFRIFAPVGEPDEVVIHERQLVCAHYSGRRFFERTVAMNDAGASFLNTLAR